MNDEVARAVAEWVDKAREDRRSAAILADHPDAPAHGICFHAQQYVEKLLKGLLTLHGVEAPRTHSLRRLIQLAAPHAPALGDLADASDGLTVHAVEGRYPGTPPPVTPPQVEALLELADRFGEMLLPLLAPEASA